MRRGTAGLVTIRNSRLDCENSCLGSGMGAASWFRKKYLALETAEHLFVDLLRSPGIDTGRYEYPICCTGPQGYIG
jgi:hypothetical protein